MRYSPCSAMMTGMREGVVWDEPFLVEWEYGKIVTDNVSKQRTEIHLLKPLTHRRLLHSHIHC